MAEIKKKKKKVIKKSVRRKVTRKATPGAGGKLSSKRTTRVAKGKAATRATEPTRVRGGSGK